MSDVEDFASEERRLPLFAQAEGGAFGASKVTPEAIERVVGGVIWGHRGRASAVKLSALMAITGKNERDVGDRGELVVRTG